MHANALYTRNVSMFKNHALLSMMRPGSRDKPISQKQHTFSAQSSLPRWPAVMTEAVAYVPNMQAMTTLPISLCLP